MEWYIERKRFPNAECYNCLLTQWVNEMTFLVLFAQVVIAHYCVEYYWRALLMFSIYPSTEHLPCCIMHLKHNQFDWLQPTHRLNCVHVYCYSSIHNTFLQTPVFSCGLSPVLNPHVPAPTVWKSWDKWAKYCIALCLRLKSLQWKAM